MNPEAGQPIQPSVSPTPPPVPNHPGPSGPSFFDRFQNGKKFFALAGMVLLVIAIPISLTLVRSEQDIRQEASKAKATPKNKAPKNKNDNKNTKDNKNKAAGNFKITCQPTQTVNLAGSKEIRAIVRDSQNKLVNGRTVVWSLGANPGGFMARVTKSSKSSKGIAKAVVESNPGVISAAEGIVTATVNGDNAICRVRVKNANSAVGGNDEIIIDDEEEFFDDEEDLPEDEEFEEEEDFEEEEEFEEDIPGGSDRILNFTVFIHGIGKGGDQANEASGGNPSPVLTSRDMYIKLTDAANSVATEIDGTMEYTSAGGNFTGSVTGSLPPGSFIAVIGTSYSPAKAAPGFIEIDDTTSTITISPVILLAGDVNSDNEINILDYQLIQGCYEGISTQPADCDEASKEGSDLNSDGKVDFIDLNLFIRELSLHKGA